MPPKKEKKSKKQLEDEKRALEEEKRIQEELERKRAEEEERKRIEEERIRKENEEKRRQEEIKRLGEEEEKVQFRGSQLLDYAEQESAHRLSQEEWRKFINCGHLPDPANEKDITTHLTAR